MNFISIVTSLLIILGAIVMAVNLLRFRAIPHMLNQLSVEEYGT